MKSSKPEPGEVSPLHSSTSSQKDSLKRDRERESPELNDSEDEGDLLEDEEEVRNWDVGGGEGEGGEVIERGGGRGGKRS